MKKPIKIEHFSFSDGIIQEYEVANDKVKLIFEDSCGSKMLFQFQDTDEVNEYDCISTSVYASRLEKFGDRTRLRLLDDDLKEMLTIIFCTYLIEEFK